VNECTCTYGNSGTAQIQCGWGSARRSTTVTTGFYSNSDGKVWHKCAGAQTMNPPFTVLDSGATADQTAATCGDNTGVTPGYTCTCPDGYTNGAANAGTSISDAYPAGGTCVDVDECTSGSSPH
jgi:hypothetical protein